MTSTELPWLLRGRTIRPFAFALTLACLAIFTGLAFRDIAGGVFDSGTEAGKVLTVASALAVALLTGGWWQRSEFLMRGGMLMAFGVWSAVFVGLGLDVGWWSTTSQIAGCWAVASAGSWLLEVSGGRQPGDPPTPRAPR